MQDFDPNLHGTHAATGSRQANNTEAAPRTVDDSRQRAKPHEMLVYDYEPLDDTGKSIRLLQVLPRSPQEPIHCTIEDCDLADQPTYTALSYTWDHGKEKACIVCDGLEVQVGENLWKFLHQFRNHRNSTGQ